MRAQRWWALPAFFKKFSRRESVWRSPHRSRTPRSAGDPPVAHPAFSRLRFHPLRLIRTWNKGLAAAFLLSLSFLIAQDPTSFMTADVARVGSRLACRCEGCRNTVGDCPMIRCHFADPMRRRVHDMQKAGMTDDEIVRDIVREEGIVALSSPPTTGWGLFTWVMPFFAIGIGLWVYTLWVRRNRQPATEVQPVDAAMLERFRDQIEAGSEEGGAEPPFRAAPRTGAGSPGPALPAQGGGKEKTKRPH
jgi:cytochrome c-type biogenesis protein CcmH/NrfF